MVDDSKENDLIKTLSLRKVQLLNEMQESQIVLANAQARVEEIDKELNLLSSLLDLHLNQQGTVVNDDKNPSEKNDNYLIIATCLNRFRNAFLQIRLGQMPRLWGEKLKISIFDIDLNDFSLGSVQTPPLPNTPQPVVNTQANVQNVNPTTNLTPTETALLSPEEQVIRQKLRRT